MITLSVVIPYWFVYVFTLMCVLVIISNLLDFYKTYLSNKIRYLKYRMRQNHHDSSIGY